MQPIIKPKKLVGEQTFCFLNESHDITAVDMWNDPNLDKLWLYNLHYFDDLNAENACQRVNEHTKIINRWIEENHPGYGNGWEPYPLSLRIVNWIKWSLSGKAMEEEWLHSLAIQIRFLSEKLEWHLLGNHLFTNAKALIFAGLYFEGEEADTWLQKGLSIIEREIPEQVLKDGGNFELSPMYHAIFLEDLLDMVNVFHRYEHSIPSKMEAAIQSMFSWMKVMTHPDGEISLFNDAALGVAANFNELEQYANRLGFNLKNEQATDLIHLKNSGYIRATNREALLIFDAAHIGPAYIPGHAHADALSIEFSLFGNRVIVNSGTSCYGTGEERLRQRSTLSHSTVEINGKNSSEVWGGFRVARRAKPIHPRAWKNAAGLHARCAHDGYKRLKGKPIHHREFVLREKTLKIIDCIDGEYKTAVGRFFLHPSTQVEIDADKQTGKLLLPDGNSVILQVDGCEVQIVKSTYHPEFGISIKNYCLEFTFIKPQAEITLNWR